MRTIAESKRSNNSNRICGVHLAQNEGQSFVLSIDSVDIQEDIFWNTNHETTQDNEAHNSWHSLVRIFVFLTCGSRNPRLKDGESSCSLSYLDMTCFNERSFEVLKKECFYCSQWVFPDTVCFCKLSVCHLYHTRPFTTELWLAFTLQFPSYTGRRGLLSSTSSRTSQGRPRNLLPGTPLNPPYLKAPPPEHFPLFSWSWFMALSRRSASWLNAISSSCTGFISSQKKFLVTSVTRHLLIQPNTSSSWSVLWITQTFGSSDLEYENSTPGSSTPRSGIMYSNLALAWLKRNFWPLSVRTRFRGGSWSDVRSSLPTGEISSLRRRCGDSLFFRFFNCTRMAPASTAL